MKLLKCPIRQKQKKNFVLQKELAVQKMRHGKLSMKKRILFIKY